MTDPRVAVLIPCLNEAKAIAGVVADFRAALPDAVVYVYDNDSTDDTAEVAAAAGAIVRRERRRGKGYVVRRMFSDIEADVYVLVDGDGTYDASSAPPMVDLLVTENLDLVNGSRLHSAEDAYRPGHRFGNAFLSGLVAAIFGAGFQDMLSGLKVCSRRFVKSFPALSEGFEIETEITVHALELDMPVAELDVSYRERAIGSSSKLSTYRDGLRILRTIAILIKEERPLQFFGLVAILLAAVAILLGIPIIAEFVRTGLVPRFPTAILASALMILATVSLACGVILDTVTRGRREMKRLHYLSIGLPQDQGDRAPRPATPV